MKYSNIEIRKLFSEHGVQHKTVAALLNMSAPKFSEMMGRPLKPDMETKIKAIICKLCGTEISQGETGNG